MCAVPICADVGSLPSNALAIPIWSFGVRVTTCTIAKMARITSAAANWKALRTSAVPSGSGRPVLGLWPCGPPGPGRQGRAAVRSGRGLGPRRRRRTPPRREARTGTAGARAGRRNCGIGAGCGGHVDCGPGAGRAGAAEGDVELALSDDEGFLEVVAVRGRATAGWDVHVDEGEAAAGVVAGQQAGQQDGVGVAHHGQVGQGRVVGCGDRQRTAGIIGRDRRGLGDWVVGVIGFAPAPRDCLPA